MRCWNCLGAVSETARHCQTCGQAVQPSIRQREAARARLDYLLNEASSWTFLPPEVRQGLQRVYQGRLERLHSLRSEVAGAGWPESDWSGPLWSRPLCLDPAQPPTGSESTAPAHLEGSGLASDPVLVGPTVTERLSQLELSGFLPPAEPESSPAGGPAESAPSPSPPVAAPSPVESDPPPAEDPVAVRVTPPRVAALTRLNEAAAPRQESLAEKVLGEADIRWFHSLGALLVVAAVVGWLRATWDGYGKNVAGLLILLSPIGLHAVAHSLRQTVPISARLLSILAGLLTPLALLAVEIFDFLPPGISGRDYWTLAFLVSGSLLAWQAQAMKERVPLYAGTLCVVMAGWSQGPLWTSALCLLVGFLLAPAQAAPDASEQELAWARQLQTVGLAAGVFGCFSSLLLFRPGQGPLKALVAFSGALIYLHLPTLTRRTGAHGENRVVLQAFVTVLGLLLMRTLLDVPASGVGLYTLLAAALFLSARPEDEGGLLALRLGSGLGLAGLVIGFFTTTPVPWGDPDADPAETVMRFLLAFLGAGLFGYLSRQTHMETQSTPLGLGALLSTFGGWYHLFLLACPTEPDGYFVRNGQLAPLMASFGLWVALWLVGSRWLRQGERALVQAVALPVLLGSVLACAVSGLESGPARLLWSPVLLWLGAVGLAWERGLLLPGRERGSDARGAHAIGRLLEALLPRIALWALALSLAYSQAALANRVAILLQVLGLGLMLSPASGYRIPALEIVWAMAPFALVSSWGQGPFPGQVLEMHLLFLAGWAAASGWARRASLALSAGLGVGVILGSLGQVGHPALLSLPLGYALCLTLPVPGRAPWSRPSPAQYGFDLLLNAALFLPLQAEAGSPTSLGLTVGVPVLAVLLSAAAQRPGTDRVATPTSAPALLLAGFLWTLGQSPRESGLLLVLASLWAFSQKRDLDARFSNRDLGNGLAILGAAWLAGGSTLIEPSLPVLAGGVLLSESLAQAMTGWRPDRSNAALTLVLLLLAPWRADVSQVALPLLAGLMVGLRGLLQANLALLTVGTLTFLKHADGQLEGMDVSLKVRVLPLAVVLLSSSVWLLMRPEHPTRAALGFHPMASLRLGIALLAVPPLLTLAVFPSIGDFAWVLAVGCGCLALSQGFGRFEDLSFHLKQSGGYVLAGWAAVSLGRAAMVLPWQLATLVVGLAMVGVGVKVERNRKGGGPQS